MANRGITYEPCTLVYTLLNEDIISFDDFCLLIRANHSFMVETIVPNEETNNVQVKLNYQASLANAISKLGDLQQVVAVTKLSAFVKENELSRLDDIRRRFNINTSSSTPDIQQPVHQPVGGPRRGRGGKASSVFAPRPAPYKKAVPKKCKQPADTEEVDAADYYPGHDPEDC
uniref:Uncharacterized protein n=1 Tax=Periparus ater parvoviridae sp. TaxID=2794527 RepID=A0A8A4XD15_9VIRU|nr:MAG: hypothetical protein [Periparus ater parvoviridae sp.]